jgi:hypothetical protein
MICYISKKIKFSFLNFKSKKKKFVNHYIEKIYKNALFFIFIRLTSIIFYDIIDQNQIIKYSIHYL